MRLTLDPFRLLLISLAGWQTNSRQFEFLDLTPLLDFLLPIGPCSQALTLEDLRKERTIDTRGIALLDQRTVAHLSFWTLRGPGERDRALSAQWAGMPTLQHDELLEEREILEEEAPTRPQKGKQRSEAQDKESKHGQEL
jgi:hypothetical protein